MLKISNFIEGNFKFLQLKKSLFSWKCFHINDDNILMAIYFLEFIYVKIILKREHSICKNKLVYGVQRYLEHFLLFFFSYLLEKHLCDNIKF